MAKLTRRGFLGQTTASVATLGLLAVAPLATVPEMADVAASDAAADGTVRCRTCRTNGSPRERSRHG
ncbi:MAG TPA: hypothetical protein DCL75_13895 [Ktedonobacter sp.]|nr:hypothetical protein [Ktedonobacter sp.]